MTELLTVLQANLQNSLVSVYSLALNLIYGMESFWKTKSLIPSFTNIKNVKGITHQLKGKYHLTSDFISVLSSGLIILTFKYSQAGFQINTS